MGIDQNHRVQGKIVNRSDYRYKLRSLDYEQRARTYTGDASAARSYLDSLEAGVGFPASQSIYAYPRISLDI